MIEFTKSYKTADGQVFGSIEDAQVHELSSLLGLANDISKTLVDKKVAVIDILTTTPNSKPKARSTHGGTKNRKKTVITNAATDSTNLSTTSTLVN